MWGRCGAPCHEPLRRWLFLILPSSLLILFRSLSPTAKTIQMWGNVGELWGNRPLFSLEALNVAVHFAFLILNFEFACRKRSLIVAPNRNRTCGQSG